MKFTRKGRKRLAIRTVGVLTLAVIAIVAFSPLPASIAMPTGIAESKEGCVCHAGGQTNDVKAILEGEPITSKKYEPGKSYELTVKAEGGVPITGQKNLGGFALSATLGELSPKDDTTQILKEAGSGRSDIVHTAKGNDQRTWTVDWKAPAEDTEVIFYLAVNTVNGDENAGQGTTGDKWNTAVYPIGEPKAKAPVPWDWILLVGMPGVLFVLIVAVYLVNSSHRPAEEE
ncbi:MAG TPA: choice-of-anchor V domain-containing protein [Thermoplasmata archaeon]|nr:choice-of-anchor V domain-containing protein [Thermoplasmata archaeon]